MIHRKLLGRAWILPGIVLSTLVLAATMLKLVEAQGSAASITIVKEADQTVVSGSTATFAITVTNTGDVTLTNVTVSDVQAPNCARVIGELVSGGGTSYVCTRANVTADFTNSATATGTPPVGDDVTDTDTAFVEVINPTIEIDKMPDDQMVLSGSTVTFTIAVSNTGDVALANVTISDAQVPACTRAIGNLAPGDSTRYECTRANVQADFINSATAMGTLPIGGHVTDTDAAFVDVISPGLEIAKTPDMQTVISSSAVSFTIAVTNTGDVTLANVTVSDAMVPDCNRVFNNLASRRSRRYECTLANVTDGFINSATVTGEPQVGAEVSDSDSAIVLLSEVQTCPADMIAYWRLDETSTTAYDDFYSGHDGECAGWCPIPAAGRVSGGQAFDGSHTGINAAAFPGDNSFNWSVQDSFSIEFWMKADSANSCALSNEVIIGRDDNPNSQLHWWVGIACWAEGKGAFVLRDKDGVTTGVVVGTTDLTDGSWHHVVAVRDANVSENRIYVDGVEEASKSLTYVTGFDSPTAALNLGWLNCSQGYHFDGIVDEVAVYDRALSPDEIRQRHNEGSVGRWYCQTGAFAPVIVSTPLTIAAVGRLYNYDVEAPGNPDPTYTLVVSPTGMTIDPATGLISWTPAPGQHGNHTIEVAAWNSEGTDTQSFTVTVGAGTICPTNMIAYWKLDEASGSAYDDFYDGHDGTCAGQCPTPAPGHVNGGQEFNGTNAGINVPADEAFDWDHNSSFSIEFWLQTDSASTCASNEVVIGRDDSSTSLHWWVGCQSGGEAAFYLMDTAGTMFGATGTTDLTNGSWHHVVAIRDASAGGIRIYVDGVEEDVEPATYAAGFGSPTAALNIGWLNLSPGYHFDGIIDEAALYDRALTAGEVQQHYGGGEVGPGYCISPDIAVSKRTHSSVVRIWDTVAYTYTLTNPGDDPLSAVTLRDDKCSPLIFLGGDSDGDNRLDPAETWYHRCSMVLNTDITNTVTVTGTHSWGGTVSDTDTVSVHVINPEIVISKLANPTLVESGDAVTYTYTVTNAGDDSLSNVNVSDDKCSPVGFMGGDNNDNYALDPGEVWIYTCSTVLSTDTTNTATATGTDSAGDPVSAVDTAFVDVMEQYRILLPIVLRN